VYALEAAGVLAVVACVVAVWWVWQTWDDPEDQTIRTYLEVRYGQLPPGVRQVRTPAGLVLVKFREPGSGRMMLLEFGHRGLGPSFQLLRENYLD
jgi:hypothetical protein